MKNEFDQAIGQTLEKWEPAKKPSKVRIVGSSSILEPLDPSAHAKKLFEILHNVNGGRTYLPYGPFDTYDDFYLWLTTMTNYNDPVLDVILDSKNQPLGIAGYLKLILNIVLLKWGIYISLVIKENTCRDQRCI